MILTVMDYHTLARFKFMKVNFHTTVKNMETVAFWREGKT